MRKRMKAAWCVFKFIFSEMMPPVGIHGIAFISAVAWFGLILVFIAAGGYSALPWLWVATKMTIVSTLAFGVFFPGVLALGAFIGAFFFPLETSR